MNLEMISGRAWRFGSDIDTDTVLPSQYMRLGSKEYATHAMEPIAPDFAAAVEPGDMIVAETNFGIGSSREQAVVALKELGVGAVIAESFARIFYRNAINEGLPAITCSTDAVQSIENGDELKLDLEAGFITDLSTGETYQVDPLTEPVKSILEAGGAVEYYSSSNRD